MNAGELRYFVYITMPTLARDDQGETTQVAGVPLRVSAGVKTLRAFEKVRAGLNATDTAYTVKIRWIDNVDETASLTYRGETLDVLGVVPGGRNNREWLILTAGHRKGNEDFAPPLTPGVI